MSSARWTPARVFLIAALGFGIPLAFVSPPLTTPDEGRHMARIYTLAVGHVRLPEGPESRIPGSLVELSRRIDRLWPPLRPRVQQPRSVLAPLWDQPLRPEAQVPVRNLATYGPLAYAPQALGFALGRVFEAPPIAMVYLGRIANLLAWALVVAFALRLTPRCRWAFAALSLLPMSLFLAASLSADVPANALALLFAASALRAGFGSGERVDRRDVALMCLSAGLLGLTKGGYWLMAGLPLLIPAARFESGRQRWTVVAAVALVAWVPSGLWLAGAQASGYTDAGRGADWTAQLRFVLDHPLRYVGIFLGSWLETGGAYLQTFLGVLGRLDVVLPGWIYAFLTVSLVALPLLELRESDPLDARRRIGLVAIFAACTGTVFTLIYLSGNPVGAPSIRGVQGRYLLPLAPLLLAALPARGSRRIEQHPAFVPLFATGVAISALVALRALWLRYYL